jgi:hypothetical protein
MRIATALALGCLCGVLLLSGLGRPVTAQEPGTPPPGIGPVLLAGLEQAEARVNAIRGFEGPVPIDRTLYTTQELTLLAAERQQTAYTPTIAARDLLFYDAFGFMPADFDLYANVQNTTVEPRSHYDAQSQSMNVRSNNDTPLSALDSLPYIYGYTQLRQDRSHDIYAARDAAISANNIDQALAINAVIHGDARLTLQFYIAELIESGQITLETVIRESNNRPETLPEDTPTILNAENRFATETGFDFVRALYDETSSWRLVDLLYERLPLSTEQILHPTLYLLYEAPHEVNIAPLDDFWTTQTDVDPDEWALSHEQTLGEFYLRQHLGLVFETDIVAPLASGWGGDRFMLYTDNQRNSIMVWRISWDTTADFADFNLRYGEFISVWLNVAGEQYADDTQCWQGAERSICKASVGDDVLMTQAPFLDLALNLLRFQRDQLSEYRVWG